MSFFKKTLASFGIGSAKVDTVISQETLIPGEKLHATIHVYGGSTAQEIDNIDVKLCCQYVEEVEVERGDSDSRRKERQKRTYVLASWQLPYAFTIEPSSEREFEVELDMPWNTPVTIGDAKVWLDTGLDIKLAIDPSDKDVLTVRPDPVMDGIFKALEEQGLRIRQVECEAAKGFELPFVQEFEFVPTTGPYHGVWRELEIVAYRDENSIKLWFEIDRQKKGLSGLLSSFLGTGELKRHLEIDSQVTPEQAGEQVLNYLDQTT
ncbi:sporulation protein [Vibrio sp. SCSIO 43136]|uniref:sporulation protein n=1 Tax=Vibrio sp. SCSIO 43136 TaxID=2819101 RepID=UPI0020754796|nr:sporulation protein [Vibrio sp. SCSIO 43136]USD65322.1 sporulation protein [Vibrio sp. SCSIO 43136]